MLARERESLSGTYLEQLMFPPCGCIKFCCWMHVLVSSFLVLPCAVKCCCGCRERVGACARASLRATEGVYLEPNSYKRVSTESPSDTHVLCNAVEEAVVSCQQSILYHDRVYLPSSLFHQLKDLPTHTHTHHFCITTVSTYLLLSFTNFLHGWQSAAITRELSAVMQKMNKLDSPGH